MQQTRSASPTSVLNTPCHPRLCFADAIKGANEENKLPATHLVLQCDQINNSTIPKVEKGFRSGIYAIRLCTIERSTPVRQSSISTRRKPLPSLNPSTTQHVRVSRGQKQTTSGHRSLQRTKCSSHCDLSMTNIECF